MSREQTMKRSTLIEEDNEISLLTIDVSVLRPGSWVNWDRVINDGDDIWDKLDKLDAKRVGLVKESVWEKEYNLERMRHLDEQRLTDEQVEKGIKTDPFYDTIMSVNTNKKKMPWRGVAARLACKTA